MAEDTKMQAGNQIDEVAVRLVGTRGGQNTSGKVRIQSWSKKERMGRALKFGGICWGLAIVSILIPLLHFILVPTLFLAGPILAFFIYAQESVVLGGEGPCPECSAPFQVARMGAQFPLSDVCSQCHKSVKVELVSG